MATRIGRAALTGFVAGLLVLGIGGRIAMRIVALIIHQTTHFGSGATLGIVFIGGVLGALGGTVYGLVLGKSGMNRAAVKGVIYGTVLFAVLATFQPPAIRAEVTAARMFWVEIIPIFWALCVCYSLVLATALARTAQGRAVGA